MIKQIKTQASFEYLITYTWIILITLLSISILKYNGILNFSIFSYQEKCDIFDQFECLGVSWKNDNMIAISLKSESPARILVKNITLKPNTYYKEVSLFDHTSGECRKQNETGELCDVDSGSFILEPGTKNIFFLEPIDSYLNDRKNLKAHITIKYYFYKEDPIKDIKTAKGYLAISR